ncbi:hypothetical protein OESDEN_00302 [Oesophagostomum dentatum]|uniref:SXP/RAL-2 family protein Ani s 5-like cation-binding domain-containing protein n=1 Tax=Oesophagostomum dentatum TaxID=61180 RepID=A0A0B1TW84_OESDE|nr:hypothetical protein OESDEN_00302 [Oesophagostomum dentatum]
MKSLLILLVFVFAATFAFDPVFVDELREIVDDKKDAKELKKLDHDDNMKRSEKKKKLDEILNKQPENIKKLYKIEVERSKLLHQIKMDKKLEKVTEQELKDHLKKEEEINNDMNISEKEADKKKDELRSKLTSKQRKSLKKD